MKPPAPEAQRLDDAIGFLRDHAEVNVSPSKYFSVVSSSFLDHEILACVYDVLLLGEFFRVCVSGNTNGRKTGRRDQRAAQPRGATNYDRAASTEPGATPDDDPRVHDGSGGGVRTAHTGHGQGGAGNI